MSVASLAGYLANSGGGGGGGDTFETVIIGESGTDVLLNCVIDNKLNINGITTLGVDLYNDAGDEKVKLRCINKNILDVNNIITYSVELSNENDTSESVILNCGNDGILSVPNISVTNNGITFPDSSVQTTAYTGGGGGNVFDTVTIGTVDSPQVVLSCGEIDVLTVEGISTGSVDILNGNSGSALLTCTTDKVLLVNDEAVAMQTYVNDTFQLLADMVNYSTTAQANGLYQTLTGMMDYSTTVQANGLYQTLTGMLDYSTTAVANGLYVSKSNLKSVVIDVAIQSGLQTGQSQTGTTILQNFVGGGGGSTSYFISQTYLSQNGDQSQFTGSCGFESTDNTSTTVTYYIRNNGAEVQQDVAVPFSILAFKL